MQFMLYEEKLPFLTWCPSGLTPWQMWWSMRVCEIDPRAAAVSRR